MNHEEWKAIVLHKMGLTQPLSVREICQQHNGVQAQFQTYADIGFKSRMDAIEYHGNWRSQLVRQWSLRGTVHAYLKEEIALYLHADRNYFKPSLQLPSRDGLVTAAEKQYYAELILETLKSGNKERQALKEVCRQNGLSQEKEHSLFNAWGGIMASLIAEGLIFQEYGSRTFGLLENYQPLPKHSAELEIARHYFSGFGPVSLTDARYYFKENKSTVERWMAQLALHTVEVAGQTRFYCGTLPQPHDIPKVLFVAGFDALLLAFEKRENPFFDARHIRDIYTMTGILKPTVMWNGSLVATWRQDKRARYINPFVPLNARTLKQIVTVAADQGDLPVIVE